MAARWGTSIDITESPVTGQPLRVRRTVVGVVHDVHQTHADVDLKDVYIPFAQTTTRFASVYIRASGSSQQWLETLRTVVASIDADVFVGPAPPLSVQSDEVLAGPRFITAMLTVFAVFAALLALLGIYGVTAYAVQQREREIAIRMAIGATSGTLSECSCEIQARCCCLASLAASSARAVVSRILQSQLHGVERFDPWTIAGACLSLVTAGLFATWLPRAASLAPIRRRPCDQNRERLRPPAVKAAQPARIATRQAAFPHDVSAQLDRPLERRRGLRWRRAGRGREREHSRGDERAGCPGETPGSSGDHARLGDVGKAVDD